MSLIAKSGGKKYANPIPDGSYCAVCYGVVDLGVQYNEQYDKRQQKIAICWELPDETVEIDGEKLPRTLTKTYTMSLHDRSQLRKDLKSWRGREFTDEELAGFSMTNIVGVPCLIQVSTTETQNGVFNNIDAVVSLPKGMPKPAAKLPALVFDSDDFTSDEFEKLPKWMQDKLFQAEGFRDRYNGVGAGQTEPLDLDDDDDLPF